MNPYKVLLAALLAAATPAQSQIPAEDTEMAQQAMAKAARLPVESELPSLRSATAWLNSPPLTPADLQGRVVLVEFGTYTCINWLRTLPYVRAWAEKYRDQGLVVIQVHAPEFEFEKDLESVRRELKREAVAFPVAVDNEHAIWRAFSNQYWPALYFADAKGNIRHHQFGEGDYEQSEAVIQQLLTEAGKGDVSRAPVSVDARGIEAVADWSNLRTQETYVGYGRTEGFASPGGSAADRRRVYDAPGRLELNHWALSGDWTIGKEVTVLHQSGGRIVYRFHARDLHMVMGPGMGARPVRFRVLIDGKPPGSAHGLDVDAEGKGTATEQRLYQLIRQSQPIGDRLFEIEFLDPGIETFSFTFG